MAFCDQERFNTDVVEAVTGIKSATLRQWEQRKIYICELRRAAEVEVNLIRVPDTPRRKRKAGELIKKHERGWRSYTWGDLLRISFIVALMESGIEALEAGTGATSLNLPESDANSHPTGIRLTHKLSAPDLADEYVVYVPKLLHFNNPASFRYDPATSSSSKVTSALRLIGEHAAVIINLSKLRRNVLQRIEQTPKSV